MVFTKKSIQRLVELVQTRYSPRFNYIQAAELESGEKDELPEDITELKIIGRFDIEQSEHLSGKPLKHVSVTETHLCMTQLSLVLIGYLVERGFVNEWGCFNFTNYFGSESNMKSENMMVAEINTCFHEQILPSKNLTGILKIIELHRTKRGNYHISFHFDLENGKHSCNVRRVILVETKELAVD